MITAPQKCPEEWGRAIRKSRRIEGISIWDISDPINPKLLSQWKTGSDGTHRNSYPGGKYAYLSAGMPGYKGHILIILDVSDPAHPKEAGRWWQGGACRRRRDPDGAAASSASTAPPISALTQNRTMATRPT